MKAGRELDARVAQFVFHWRNVGHVGGWWYGMAPSAESLALIPRYSTDLAAARQIVDLLAQHGFGIVFGDNWCLVSRDADIVEQCEAVGRSNPHAICLAALKVVGATP